MFRHDAAVGNRARFIFARMSETAFVVDIAATSKNDPHRRLQNKMESPFTGSKET